MILHLRRGQHALILGTLKPRRTAMVPGQHEIRHDRQRTRDAPLAFSRSSRSCRARGSSSLLRGSSRRDHCPSLFMLLKKAYPAGRGARTTDAALDVLDGHRAKRESRGVRAVCSIRRLAGGMRISCSPSENSRYTAGKLVTRLPVDERACRCAHSDLVTFDGGHPLIRSIVCRVELSSPSPKKTTHVSRVLEAVDELGGEHRRQTSRRRDHATGRDVEQRRTDG